MAKCLTVFAASFAAVLTASGQTQAPRPEFRSSTDIAHIDVTALDSDRRPVRGLTAADFTLRVAGKVQPIRAFAAVDVPGPPPTAMTLAPWTRDVAPDVQTNTGPNDSRLVVIFFDRSIPAGPMFETAKKVARAAINELGPNDLAALTAVRGGPAHDFTADRGRLLTAINRLQSGVLGGGGQAVLDQQAIDAGFAEAPALFRAHDACYCNACVLEQIRDISDALREVPRPKVLLFIGSQLTMGTNDIDPMGGPLSPITVECQSPIKLARDSMYRSMDLAGVTVHSLDPTGLQPLAGLGADSSIRGARVIAQTRESRTLTLAYHGQIRVLPDRTGGRVVTNTNAPEALVPAVMAESTAYYVLGFDEPPVTDRGPKVEVTVARRGVKVHVQRAFERRRADEAYGSAGASSSVSMTPSAGGVSSLLQAPSGLVTRAVQSLLPERGLPLSSSVLPFATPGSLEPAVLTVSGLQPPTAEAGFAAPRPLTGRVDMLVSALTLTAQPKAEDRQTIAIASTGPRHYDVASRLDLRPGSYEIRIGAAAEDGRIGSVITYVDVPDFRKEELSLSGLALTTVPGGAATASGGVADLVPFVPTARRAFSRADVARAYLQIYQGGSDALVPVQLDVRIVDTRGGEMLHTSGTLGVDRFAGRSADFGVDLPLMNLAAGEYLLSVSVTEGKHTARRDVRFTVQ